MAANPLPKPDVPLYNHPLPDIERWLQEQGCVQDVEQLHVWRLEQSQWQAELSLDTEALTVLYQSGQEGQQSVRRSFQYSLSRQDIQDAVFAGP